MIYRKYGGTNKNISVLGFGGSRFKRKDYEKDIDYPVSIIRKASELGINFFDTSPHYCDDKSEEIFGAAFRSMPNKFFVSTKSRILEDHSSELVRRRIETSLKKLGVEKIHFYDMWAISSMEEYMAIVKKGGAYEGAAKARDEGLIDHITFSSRLPSKDIIKIIKDGYFDGVTLSYNIINFESSEKALNIAKKTGIGVAIMTPLAGGVITRYPNYFNFFRKDKIESIAQAALRFVVSTPGVTTALCGIPTLEKLYNSSEHCNKIKKFSRGQLDKIKENINKHLKSLCNSCHKCIGVCPNNIYIHMYMEAYNLKIVQANDVVIKNKLVEMKNRQLNQGTSPLNLCDECGKCEEVCSRNLDIIERIRYILQNIDTSI